MGRTRSPSTAWRLGSKTQLPLLWAIHRWSFLRDFRGKYLVRAALIRAAAWLQRATGPAALGLKSGITIEMDLSIGMCRWVLTNDVEEDRLADILDQTLRPGDFVVDVGGNLGFFALLCAQRVAPTGQVWSFEPGTRMRALLRKNLSLNAAGQCVSIRHVALGETQGSSSLQVVSGNEHAAYLAPEGSQRTPGSHNSEDIAVACLDEIATAADPPIRLLKVDVEGSELQVLRGARRTIARDRPYLLVELSTEQQARFGYHPLELVSWLASQGYKVSWTGALDRPFRDSDIARGRFIDVLATPEGG